MLFADWLRDKLDQKNLTARQFAARIGVSHTTVDNWLRDKKPTYPRRGKAPAIALVLDVSEREVRDAMADTPPTVHDEETLIRLLDLPSGVRVGEIRLGGMLIRALHAYNAAVERSEEERSEWRRRRA
jgi:transcriptional regulator with XRE-family HTH domain